MKRAEVKITPDGGLWMPEDGGIADNQSPDLLNLRFQNGALTLRPGLVKKCSQSYGKILDVYPRDGRRMLLERVTQNGDVTCEKYGLYLLTPTALLTFDGQSFEKLADMLTYDNGQWVRQFEEHDFTGCFLLPAGEVSGSSSGLAPTGSVALAAQGEGVYLIGSGQFLKAAPTVVSQAGDYPFTNLTGGLLLAGSQAYLPTLFTGCTPTGSGHACEERNLIGSGVSQSFTTDGKATLYQLCDSMLDDKPVTVRFTPPSGQQLLYTFYAGFTTDRQGGVTATLSRQSGTISFSTAPAAALPPYESDNLVVSWFKSGATDLQPLQSRFGSWSALESGGQLFLSGNPEHPNTIWYSGADNPAYFPQSNRLGVGDPSDPVPAFGRQYDILAVFKQNGVYSVTGGAGSLTLRQVHEGCGCDMPGSVGLIDNSLVWGSTKGGLYILRSTSVKDERAVRPISAAVNPLLLSLDRAALQNSVSFDSGSDYLLFAGQEVFLWNYAETPYPSGKTNRQAQRALTFYRWHLPVSLGCPFLLDDQLCLCSDDGSIYTLDPAQTADDGAWFEAFWASKPFDFGSPGNKLITGLSFRFRSEEPVRVKLECYDGCDLFADTLSLTPTSCDIALRPPAIWRQNVPVKISRLPSEMASFSIGGVSLSGVLAGPANS